MLAGSGLELPAGGGRVDSCGCGGRGQGPGAAGGPQAGPRGAEGAPTGPPHLPRPMGASSPSRQKWTKFEHDRSSMRSEI